MLGVRVPDRVARQLGLLDARDGGPRKVRPSVRVTPRRVLVLRRRRLVATWPTSAEVLASVLTRALVGVWP